MKNTLPEVDAYIAKAAPFARPILKKVRRLFHEACPQIQETIKWGFPHFEYTGIVGSMAAFKEHAGFGFWKGKLLSDPLGLFNGVGETSMSAVRITSVAELPADEVLLSYIREAVTLNEERKSVPKPPKKKAARKELEIPADFLKVLKKDKAAHTAFKNFSYSHQKEYVGWITEAKRDKTRQERIATALEWLAAGKSAPLEIPALNSPGLA